MEINGFNLTRTATANTKASLKSSNSSDFNKVFDNTNQIRQANKEKQVSRYNQSGEDRPKSLEKPESNNYDETKTKPISNEEKSALKEAGMSDKEIESIKTEGDLKEAIVKKLLGGESNDKEDLNSLLAMLLTMANGNFNTEDYSNLKEFAKQNSDTLIKVISNGVSQSNINSDFAKSLKSTQNSDILKLFSESKVSDKLSATEVVAALSTNGNDILKNIQAELSKILKDNLNTSKTSDTSDKLNASLIGLLKSKLNDSSTNKVDESKSQEGSKLHSENTQAETLVSAVAKNDGKSSETKLSMESGNSKTDEDFLKNLLSDNNNGKISKVTNFMAQFNNAKIENANVANVDNLVINKNNLGADIIKTVKFMELNNMKDLTVKINPKELGEVVIKLTMESGAMKATITASNKEAYNLLNSNLIDMTNKLQNSDMKIESLALNVYNEDTTFFKDGSNSQRSNEENKGRKGNSVGAIAEEEIDNLSAVDNNLNILA